MNEKKQFTLDEWFYHWLADENKFLDVIRLLLKIIEVCDKIALQKDTRLARKFYLMDAKSAQWPPAQREAVKFVAKGLFTNLLKTYWVEEVPELDPEIEKLLPRKDIYLVKICLQTKDKILVTTDQKLYDSLLQCQQHLHITPVFADDFIADYLKTH